MPTKTNNKKRSAVEKIHRRAVKAAKNLYVSGIYPDHEHTRAGIDALIASGFSESDLAAALMATVRVENLRREKLPHAGAMPDTDRKIRMTARSVGSMLALSSMPLVAPMLLAAPLLGPVFGWESTGMGRKNQSVGLAGTRITITVTCPSPSAAKSAAEILDRTQARNLAIGELLPTAEEDLKRREYVDDFGGIHHHTHAYMEDHAEELRN